MIEIPIEHKEIYLNLNFPFDSVPDLDEKARCLHCGETITVGDYKVFKDEDDEEYICCPNAPKCNGTVIDWVPIEE